MIPDERQAGADEVEVTEEMIEAGVEELAKFDPRDDSLDAAVYSVFMSMYRRMDRRSAEDSREPQA